MILLVAFILIVIAFAAMRSSKSVFNPITMMLVIWAVILPFSDSNLYNLKPTSNISYVIIPIGLLAFTLGAAAGMRSRWKIRQFRRLNESEGFLEVNYTFLYIIAAICLAVLLYQSFQAAALMRRGYTFAAIRKLLFSDEENEMRATSGIVILQKFIVTPGVNLLTTLIPVELFLVKKDSRRNGLLIMSLISLVLWAFSSGGRTIIAALALYFVTCLWLKNRESERRTIRDGWIRERSLLAAVVVAALVIAVYTITIGRKGANVDLVRQAFIYFGAPPKFLDYNIDKLDNQFGGFRAYGMSSFYGFLYPILFAVRFLTGSYPEAFTQTHELSVTMLQTVVSMGGGIRINAFATMFYQPYIDGGIPGVILVLLFFGLISGKAFHSAFKKRNLLGLLLFLSFEYQILFSMIRFWYTQVGSAIWVLFIFFAVRAAKKQTSKVSENSEAVRGVI